MAHSGNDKKRDKKRYPFVVGVYHGFSKPSCPNDYLLDFVAETSKLEAEGFLLNGMKCLVTICGFCCDAPARAFISQT